MQNLVDDNPNGKPKNMVTHWRRSEVMIYIRCFSRTYTQHVFCIVPAVLSR